MATGELHSSQIVKAVYHGHSMLRGSSSKNIPLKEARGMFDEFIYAGRGTSQGKTVVNLAHIVYDFKKKLIHLSFADAGSGKYELLFKVK